MRKWVRHETTIVDPIHIDEVAPITPVKHDLNQWITYNKWINYIYQYKFGTNTTLLQSVKLCILINVKYKFLYFNYAWTSGLYVCVLFIRINTFRILFFKIFIFKVFLRLSQMYYTFINLILYWITYQINVRMFLRLLLHS